jgi:hypothetical protein
MEFNYEKAFCTSVNQPSGAGMYGLYGMHHHGKAACASSQAGPALQDQSGVAARS